MASALRKTKTWRTITMAKSRNTRGDREELYRYMCEQAMVDGEEDLDSLSNLQLEAKIAELRKLVK